MKAQHILHNLLFITQLETRYQKLFDVFVITVDSPSFLVSTSVA